MTEFLLKPNSLSKNYNAKSGREDKALKRINISFEDRWLVFVLGKSGSGKTTLLNFIGGLDSATTRGMTEGVAEGQSEYGTT
jgi:ABC-type lipoprotein export system ATPase subunit